MTRLRVYIFSQHRINKSLKKSSRLLLVFAILIPFLQFGFAQTSTGTLRGQVVDPSGAAVANATIAIIPAAGAPISATTNGQGGFEVKLPAGKYTVDVTAAGFSLYRPAG